MCIIKRYIYCLGGRKVHAAWDVIGSAVWLSGTSACYIFFSGRGVVSTGVLVCVCVCVYVRVLARA